MLSKQHPSLNDRGRHVGRFQHVALPNTSLGCVGTPGQHGRDCQNPLRSKKSIMLRIQPLNSIRCTGTSSITQGTTERGHHQSKACDVGSLGRDLELRHCISVNRSIQLAFSNQRRESCKSNGFTIDLKESAKRRTGV